MTQPTTGVQGTGTYTAVADASGNATVTIRTNGFDTWILHQISVEMPDAPIGAQCNIRKNSYPITPLVPNSDAASGAPSIQLLQTDTVTVEWTGCTPGDVGKVTVIYDRLRPR